MCAALLMADTRRPPLRWCVCASDPLPGTWLQQEMQKRQHVFRRQNELCRRQYFVKTPYLFTHMRMPRHQTLRASTAARPIIRVSGIGMFAAQGR